MGDAGVIEYLKPVASAVDDIKAVTDIIGVLTETGGTLTADGAIQNVVIADAPTGLFNPMYVFIDLTNMAAGDEVVIKIHYRLKSGGDYIPSSDSPAIYSGVIALPGATLALRPNKFGFKVTLQQTLHPVSYKTFDWEYFYEV